LKNTFKNILYHIIKYTKYSILCTRLRNESKFLNEMVEVLFKKEMRYDGNQIMTFKNWLSQPMKLRFLHWFRRFGFASSIL
jgi:hypothetical protein